MTTHDTSPGGGSADEAKRKLEGAAETIKADAAAAKDDAAARAESVAERGKETGAGHLDAFADAVRKAADELGEQDQSAAAQFVREAAGGLESLSGSLREKSVGDLVDSVCVSEGRTRRHFWAARCWPASRSGGSRSPPVNARMARTMPGMVGKLAWHPPVRRCRRAPAHA